LWRDEFVFTRRSTGSVGEGIAKTPFFLPNLGIGTSVHFQ